MLGVYLAVVFLAMSISWTTGVPLNGTTTPTPAAIDEDLPECYAGMRPDIFQCVPDEEKYLYCKVEAKKRCQCAEGLVCKRETFTHKASDEERCHFRCILEDPTSYGMKSPLEWDENMEFMFK